MGESWCRIVGKCGVFPEGICQNSLKLFKERKIIPIDGSTNGGFNLVIAGNVNRIFGQHCSLRRSYWGILKRHA